MTESEIHFDHFDLDHFDHFPRKFFLFVFFLTYNFCHFVKGKALITTDCNPLIMMLPRGKDKQLTSRTGFHSRSTRFRQI